jgi:hypothetical protein
LVKVLPGPGVGVVGTPVHGVPLSENVSGAVPRLADLLPGPEGPGQPPAADRVAEVGDRHVAGEIARPLGRHRVRHPARHRGLRAGGRQGGEDDQQGERKTK